MCLALASCGRHSESPSQLEAAAEEKVVNIYNWYDYIKPEVLRKFEAQYGIQVRYNVFDSNNTLEAKLLAGHSGSDVVFPSGAYLARMIQEMRTQLSMLGESPALPTMRPRSEHVCRRHPWRAGPCCLIRQLLHG